MTLGLRPDRLRVPDSGTGRMSGCATLVEHLGDETIVHVETDAGPPRVRPAGGRTAHIGERLDIALDMAGANPFGENGRSLDLGAAP